ncbi:MAG: hypothetical protein ACE5LU_05245 [Anaerolineae bacterium]
MATREARRALTNGVAAAAVLAAGIGSFVLGLFTTLAAASEGVKGLVNWYGPAGPLSGKSGLAVIAWLVSWAVLHIWWKDRDVNFDRIFTITVVLIGLGLLLTFPPVFEAFE